MKRSRIKIKANKTGSKEDLKLYKIQCNVKKNFRKEKMEKTFGIILSHILQIKVYPTMHQFFWWKTAKF